MKKYDELIEELDSLQEGVYDKGIFHAIFLAGGPGCFSPETPVWTVDGYKRIDELKEGDLVKTLDDENNVIEAPVTSVLKNAVHGLIEVIMEDDTKVVCSADHEFRLANNDWKEASNLVEGDDLYTASESTQVAEVNVIAESADFYDIRVDGTHNYFVTERNINVHNSGKSYVTKNTTSGLNLKVINSDDAFERGLRLAGLSSDLDTMGEKDFRQAMDVRDRAKNLTKMKQSLAIKGRLGLVIDGTGKDFAKIQRQSESLKQLGYDTHMIFVNTSLETALERNQMRPRKVPEDIVKQSWAEVQNNMGKFQNYFGPKNFILVDNNDANEDVLTKVYKRVMKLINKPVQNHLAKKWVEKELESRRRT